MNDKVISLVPTAEAKETDNLINRENHFHLKSFLSFREASDYVDEVVESYDPEIYEAVLVEIRNINQAYRAGVTIFKRQGELF